MTKIDFLKNYNKVYFMGVGGVSMSALCRFTLKNHDSVYGFDRLKSKTIDDLILDGMIFKRLSFKELKDSLIVYTSAVENTEDFLSFKSKGLSLMKRSVYLSKVQSLFRSNIAVSGSHGKTTVTSMIAHVMICAKKHPTAFIGGFDNVINNYHHEDKRGVCVVEACEYKKNFLDLKRDVSVVLNVDNDHLDSYIDFSDMLVSFKKFCLNTFSVVCSDDVNFSFIAPKKFVTYGIKSDALYRAKDIIHTKDGVSFSLYVKGKYIGDVLLNVKGEHNVQNALACIAVSRRYKIPYKTIFLGLKNFKGVKRRMESIGEYHSKKIICDYAHHPTEIEATLRCENLDGAVVVFQPHTFSRTKILMSEFLRVLKNVKCLIIHKEYPAREKYDVKGSAKTLYFKLISQSKGKVYYTKNLKEIKDAIENFEGTDKVYFLGAGDVYELAVKMTEKK